MSAHTPNYGDADKLVKNKPIQESYEDGSEEIFEQYMGGFATRKAKPTKQRLVSENHNRKKYKNYNQWINESM